MGKNWERIRQLAMEVHVASDVKPISQFLKDRGDIRITPECLAASLFGRDFCAFEAIVAHHTHWKSRIRRATPSDRAAEKANTRVSSSSSKTIPVRS
jgi:hypothetical protein